ncbi:MAG: DUF1385 domain-containing protein [Candidatus Eisenbacteria bacterium]|uniref:DUF1385 domain-containing protein n=1 Tax=Eiseniibacteriota bacterium TaxID=2212470 RepID=A0A538U6L2_UNCEI|nr:MAG: DUF1385 domain-containing protein [Candidatus Eisenbacteria bacterium]
MMRSPSGMAVAVRRADGTVAMMEKPFISITRKIKVLGWPFLRGAVSLFETLYLGTTALQFSADEASRDDDGKAPLTGGAQGMIQTLTSVLALGLGILMFVVLPAKLTEWLGFQGRIAFGLVDGLFRLLAFMLYLLLISQWKEMARVLGYHGAEHKAIHALENRAPLTPESVQSFSRFHPRCGTSFLFLVVVVSVVVFTFIGKPRGIGEFIRLSGKYADRPVVRSLIWPGMQFQRLTTREPDLAMCEVAIAALERVRSDEVVRRFEAAPTDARPEVAFIQ